MTPRSFPAAALVVALAATMGDQFGPVTPPPRSRRAKTAIDFEKIEFAGSKRARKAAKRAEIERKLGMRR